MGTGRVVQISLGMLSQCRLIKILSKELIVYVELSRVLSFGDVASLGRGRCRVGGRRRCRVGGRRRCRVGGRGRCRVGGRGSPVGGTGKLRIEIVRAGDAGGKAMVGETLTSGAGANVVGGRRLDSRFLLDKLELGSRALFLALVLDGLTI